MTPRDPDLFNYVAPKPPAKNPLDGMHRKPDHGTSVDAAKAVIGIKNHLQQEIYDLLLLRDMTDGELETLEQFSRYSPSTVRKRRSELFQNKRVVDTGARRNGFKVWRAVQQ